jgi:Major Facilitator Superfamily
VNAAAESAAPASPVSASPASLTFRSVFAVGEYRTIWLAQLLSVAGDQLARVALTVLVYDQTRSALWSAVTYAVTLVPWIFGGLALSGLADRLPRRQLMVSCDLARMVLTGVMALLSLRAGSAAGLGVLVVLLFAVTLLDSPFKAARSAMLPDVLPGDLYPLGVAASQTALQTGMVAGFALGGIIVAAVHVSGALSLDAATFAASALVLQLGVRARPAAAGRGPGASALAGMAAGVRLVFGRARLRTLVLFGWLVAFYIVPMGLAAPYAASLHARAPLAMTTGLVFAAGPLGTMAGAIALSRLVPVPRRQAWLGALAILACGSLALLALRPGLAAALAVLAVSGAGSAYQLVANAAFVAEVPAGRRGQAFGLANGGMQVLQGLWIVAAGAVAAHALAPGAVIAVSGGIGAVLAAGLALSRYREGRQR